LGGCLILASALLLALTAAAQAAGILTARNRSKAPSGKGHARFDSPQQMARERERLISALVLARTICLVTGTSTAIGLVTARTGVSLRPILATAVACVVVAAVIESIPRVIVTHNPERWHPVFLPVARVLQAALFVPSYLFDVPARAVLRIGPFRSPPDQSESNGELIRLVEMEESEGGIEEDERQMIRAVIELEDTTAREVMIPRIDITAVDTSASLPDVAQLIAERGVSRIPLHEGGIDNIVGVIYAKDVLAEFARGNLDVDLKSIAREPLFVPESKPLDELLRELRDRRIHMAIVVDEYGGTAGLLTIEDVVEEIVGEIEDEYDHSEPHFVRTSEGGAVIDAREHVYILRELFDVEVPQDDFDTIGGLIIHQMGRIPSAGDAIDIAGLRLRVLSVTGRRIRKVSVTRLEPSVAAHAEGA
jgi:CBS domain containing-hemolysin-like protein